MFSFQDKRVNEMAEGTKNRGLIFIPDISGFTRFVTETEIDHSRLIIQELLETLINANDLGLEISEIEGDAILFYKFGDLPDLKDLSRQVERMFRAFHKNLVGYDIRRYCWCEACNSAISLTLKVISHYGEFTGYNVKTFSKLIGKDIIVAHELLKNEIDNHEYWLVTQSLLRDGRADAFESWMEWNTGAKETRSGPVSYHYTPLGGLKNGLAAEPFEETPLTDKVKVLSLSREYMTDLITLFHATGEFDLRSRWREGVIKVEEVEHFLPRVGMRCRCVMENGEAYFYSNSYRHEPDRLEFSEVEEGRQHVLRYVLESIAPHTTRLTLEYYVPKNLPGELLFRLIQKEKLERNLEQSMANLDGLVKDLPIPGGVASS